MELSAFGGGIGSNSAQAGERKDHPNNCLCEMRLHSFS